MGSGHIFSDLPRRLLAYFPNESEGNYGEEDVTNIAKLSVSVLFLYIYSAVVRFINERGKKRRCRRSEVDEREDTIIRIVPQV